MKHCLSLFTASLILASLSISQSSLAQEITDLGDLSPEQLQEEMFEHLDEFEELNISPAPVPAPAPTDSKNTARQPKTGVSIVVNRSTHKVHLTATSSDGKVVKKIYNTSTGGPGHETPKGKYNVTGMIWNARSSTYNNAPMSWAVFFKGPFLYALHATPESNYRYLGKQNVSHGCVRLTFESAREVYDLVKQYGAKKTTIEVL